MTVAFLAMALYGGILGVSIGDYMAKKEAKERIQAVKEAYEDDYDVCDK
jgi:surface antigen